MRWVRSFAAFAAWTTFLAGFASGAPAANAAASTAATTAASTAATDAANSTPGTNVGDPPPARNDGDRPPAKNDGDRPPARNDGDRNATSSSPAPEFAAPSPDAFYASRLAIGEQALVAGRAAEAADNLRVASFGLLDRPEKLSQCLVSLAVAQQRAGRAAEADATLRRFQSVQELYPSWGSLALAPGIRSEFVELARKRLPGMNLPNPREAGRQSPPAPRGAPSAGTSPSSPPIADASGPGRTSPS